MLPTNAYIKRVLENFANHKHDTFADVYLDGKTLNIKWHELENACVKVINELNQITNTNEEKVVLIFLPHGCEVYPTFIGSMLGGYIPSFMPCPSSRQNPDLYWSSHQELINKIQPAAIITTAELMIQIGSAGLSLGTSQALVIEDMMLFDNDEITGQSSIDEVYVDECESSIAFLQHSSGTTGLKKGIALSYEAIAQHSRSYGKALEISEKDTIASWLPLYHDMGLIACLITPLYFATKIVQISPFEWLNRPNLLFKLIEKHDATLCWLPNFAFEHLTNTISKHAGKYDLSNLKSIICCSEPCKAKTFARFCDAFAQSGVKSAQLSTCYAMAETVFGATQYPVNKTISPLLVNIEKLNRGDTVQITAASDLSAPLLSCGIELDGISIKIVDELRKELSQGVIGEISIEGDYLFSGYYKDADRTREKLINGRYYTNDLGFMWENELYVLGRLDDLIIINGRNIMAHEVETMVSGIDGVKPGRAVAISTTDNKVGSDVLVVMVERDTKTKVDDSTLTNSIIEKLSSEIDVVPREVTIHSAGSLIKTSSGKMSRKENKSRYHDFKLNQTKTPKAA